MTFKKRAAKFEEEFQKLCTKYEVAINYEINPIMIDITPKENGSKPAKKAK